MLVLLPTTGARTMIRQQLRVAVGVALLSGSLVGAAFLARPARAPRVAQDSLDSTARSRRSSTIAAPVSGSFAQLTDSLARDVEQLTSLPSILPTVGWVSSRFTLHRHHPVLHVTRAHEGIDIAAPAGAPVIAPAAGVVVATATRPGYGLLLELDHGRGVVTRYGHLSRIVVHSGQVVMRGQLLANVGSSGLSTGPHLHYEIRVAGAVVDPLLFGQ
jgi:murein DD-endopeptidase MepM/ murein hydrolase activator NlpD